MKNASPFVVNLLHFVVVVGYCSLIQSSFRAMLQQEGPVAARACRILLDNQRCTHSGKSFLIEKSFNLSQSSHL